MNAQPDPGTSEQRLTEVLAAYLEAIDAGWAPEQQAFLDRYPDLAPELQVFFQNQDQVAHLAHSLPPPMHANGRGQSGSGSWNPAEAPTLPQTDSAPSTDLHLENVRNFDNYEILEEVSRGGMGIVFKARQRGLGRLVALKMILAGQHASPIEIQRFLHESENASLLDHPNIVPVYTVGEFHGQRYFTMKLIEGGNLNEHLPRLSQDLKAGVRVLVTAARAVHYAHQRGVLHRDLKPANVLLDKNDQPHITDFGLAKRIPVRANLDGPNIEAGYVAPEQIAQRDGRLTTLDEDSPGQATTLSAIAGTPSYMPPEQAGPQRGGLTTAADVYSLGAILYKMLTGQPPFRGDSWQATLEQVRENQPPSPSSLKPRVSRDLEAICLKCLCKRPEGRYASAQALAEDLERWTKGQPVEARPRSWPSRLAWTLYRHAVLCVFMAIAGFAAGLAFMACYWFDPDRPLKQLERKLARGEKVALIAETGPPKWYKGLPFDRPFVVYNNPDNPFSISSLHNGYVGLMPTPPLDRYRFSAEVRHDGGLNTPRSETGIFFGYMAWGKGFAWCELSFADQGDFPPPLPAQAGNPAVESGRLYLNCVSVDGPQAKNRRDIVHPSVSQDFTPVAQMPNNPVRFRQLAVDVTPEFLTVWWERNRLAIVSWNELEEPWKNRHFPHGAVSDLTPLTVHPQGALGVFVIKGESSFRNVILEPLP
jgi:serine/threonine protein kinase